MRETFTKIFDEILDYNQNVDNYEVLKYYSLYVNYNNISS